MARARKLPRSPEQPGQDGATVPAPRPPAPAPAPARSHGCPGLDGQCEAPVPVAGQLCRACRTPCAAGCGASAHPGRGDGLCATCGGQREERALPSCTACGEQPTEHAPGDVGPEEAFAALLGTECPACAGRKDVQAPF